jgi:hypothetical protein
MVIIRKGSLKRFWFCLQSYLGNERKVELELGVKRQVVINQPLITLTAFKYISINDVVGNMILLYYPKNDVVFPLTAKAVNCIDD